MSTEDRENRNSRNLIIRDHVRKQLRRLLGNQSSPTITSSRLLPRQAPSGGSEPVALQDNGPIASLPWVERQQIEVLAALPIAVYTTDAAGRITFYNEAAAALWGRRPVLGQEHWCGAWRLFWSDGTPLPHDQCPMALAIREARKVRGLTAVLERPDGTRVCVRPLPSPLKDVNDNLVGAINVVIDLGAA